MRKLLALLVVAVIPLVGEAQVWVQTDPLAEARHTHTATEIGPNKVLVVAGGDVSGMQMASAQIYDRAHGTWTSTSPLVTPRVAPTATLLPSGKVLVTGGVLYGWWTYVQWGAEVYDPKTESWSDAGTMTIGRLGHTATVLETGPNAGKVLVVGGEYIGYATCAVTATADLYDPATNTWSATGSLGGMRYGHTATRLETGPNAGKVLVTGGGILSVTGCGCSGDPRQSAEIYDPDTGTWSLAGTLSSPRVGHTATLLPSGRVLLAGGTSDTSAELYDPVSGTSTPTGSLATARTGNTATLLENGTDSGKVLVAGGFVAPWDGSTTSSAELYDSATGTWTPTNSLWNQRALHTATMLNSGEVLVVGGYVSPGNNVVATVITGAAELYQH